MNKRRMLITVALLFAVNTASGFAATPFSDVPNDHWGKGFIEKAADKKIINGYLDDKTLQMKFKPESPVNYVESVQMIYNTLKATNKLKANTGLIQKHSANMTANNIPEWAREAVAYALEYNILHKDDLKSFTNKDTLINAKRVDVAVFLGKALDMESALDPLPMLKFVDAETIKSQAVPYVDLLVDKKIISGDGENKFNPNQTITRVQMATMCWNTYELLNTSGGNTIVVPPTQTPTPTPTNPTEKTLEVTIDYVAEDTKMIVVKDTKGDTKVYNLTGVSIKVNGKTKSIGDLSKGDIGKLTFDGTDTLKAIEINNAVTTMEGKIQKISDVGDYHLLKVEDQKSALIVRELKIYDTTEIEYDDEKVSVSKLDKDDIVYIKYVGDRVISIEIVEDEKEYSGILESAVNFKTNPSIKLKLNDGKVMEFEIDDDASIRRDGSKENLDALEAGDLATVIVEYGKVVKITATSIAEKSKDEGVIKEIIIGNPSKITILNEDKKTVTYEISKSATIKIDGATSDLKDLEIQYEVELRLDKNKVTRITADAEKSKDTITGEIVKLYDKYDRLSVSVFDKTEKDYVTISVEVTDDTIILSNTGTTIRLSRLDEEDMIFIDGYYDDDVFVANKIIQLK
ncbi:hypothetical protein HNQ80_001692 [Anaerosolibacter carboniphilus]|uniref:SLH domain-containing protein n=1 Tax=Anaerosolibacter carboniphilus TaxID=1417629 RepID=A0A841KQA8_9FIRM|nr:S-layer homology domain-containing protein [Anaerosolibacter carboniphilus]MBB6215603.1 hypothetical protein [Anaerosolibacter carboniphilus]